MKTAQIKHTDQKHSKINNKHVVKSLNNIKQNICILDNKICYYKSKEMLEQLVKEAQKYNTGY